MLIGGNGRDVLIGVVGADRLAGNSSDDILVAGTTAFALGVRKLPCVSSYNPGAVSSLTTSIRDE